MKPRDLKFAVNDLVNRRYSSGPMISELLLVRVIMHMANDILLVLEICIVICM